MNTKIIALISGIVVVAIIAGVFFATNGGGGGAGGYQISIVDYSVSAGDSSPVLTLKFSTALKYPASVELINSSFRTVGVWVSQSEEIGKVVELNKITPPNLIGKYYVVVKWKSTTVMNKTITFIGPELSVVSYQVQKVVKGDDVYLESVQLTIKNSGDSPYYYNRIRWTLEDAQNGEKLPENCFSTSTNGEITINIGKYYTSGAHELVVHFDYFDFTTITVEETLNL